MNASTQVHGTRELSASLRSGSAEVRRLIELVVEKSAGDLRALAQRNASGRPGPNAPTGDLRGSIRVEKVGRDGATVSRSVGTDRPQALRLEYGFVGVDSLNRQYDQQPYQFMGPATDVVEPIFHAAMAQVAERALR